MKMKIFKTGTTKITLQGEDFMADSNGIIDVPDDRIDSSIWGKGFVAVTTARQTQQEPPAVPERSSLQSRPPTEENVEKATPPAAKPAKNIPASA
jgi:hypothetical protein